MSDAIRQAAKTARDEFYGSPRRSLTDIIECAMRNLLASQEMRKRIDLQNAQPAPIAGEGELVERITGHLASGGLFNPEMAIHDRVRDLLIDCRHALEIRAERVKEAVEAEREACAKVAYKTPFRCHAEYDGDFHSGCVQTRDGIVDAIRSRGDKEGT